MKGIFSALEYLHNEGNVIHRDIKPENVVIMDYDDLTKVKIIDFGLAVKLTKKGVHDFAKCGTLLYTPPEQILKNFAYAKVSQLRSANYFCIESRHVGGRHNHLLVTFSKSPIRQGQIFQKRN
jgi:serine/threonine protein kinase